MQSVYYNNLGANKRIYDAALQCFQNRGRSFPVTGSIQAAELAIEVLNDHPEIFYVGQEFRVMSSLMRRDIMPAYLYSPAEATKIRGQLDAAAQSIISEHINDHQSDYDKVRSLHDYLKSNLEYDTVAASSHRPNERNIAEAHNIIGALLKHKCVCEGFAKAFKFLCDKIDLECWVVSGKGSSSIGAGPHAWNIVKINGYYHHVDVTWDNQYSDSSSMPNYGYMNLSDDEIAKDHTWNKKHYPECPSSPYNYFRVNNALLDSKKETERWKRILAWTCVYLVTAERSDQAAEELYKPIVRYLRSLDEDRLLDVRQAVIQDVPSSRCDYLFDEVRRKEGFVEKLGGFFHKK